MQEVHMVACRNTRRIVLPKSIKAGHRRSGTGASSVRIRVVVSSLALLSSFLFSLATGEQKTAETEPSKTELKGVLESALTNPGTWEDIRVEASCLTETGPTFVEVFGQGVGVWKREKQFPVSKQQFREILEEFRDAGFVDWHDLYGGSAEPGAGVKIICRAGLSIDSNFKMVSQTEKGKQFHPLRTLTARIFALSRGSTAEGVIADSLTDGLRKLETGKLNPVTFQLLLHRRIEDRAELNKDQGWILRVDGRRASHQTIRQKAGYSDPVELDLSEEEFLGLTRTLAISEVESFPLNLFADSYTDLSLQILNRKKSVQARQFRGVTPDTHGERQRSFDKILALLTKLNSKVESSGQPVVAPTSTF